MYTPRTRACPCTIRADTTPLQEGLTPLYFAMGRDTAVMGQLIEAGASVNHRMGAQAEEHLRGKTVLQLTQEWGETEDENFLKAHGAE